MSSSRRLPFLAVAFLWLGRAQKGEVPGIGAKTIEKIDEFLKTGKIQMLVGRRMHADMHADMLNCTGTSLAESHIRPPKLPPKFDSGAGCVCLLSWKQKTDYCCLCLTLPFLLVSFVLPFWLSISWASHLAGALYKLLILVSTLHLDPPLYIPCPADA